MLRAADESRSPRVTLGRIGLVLREEYIGMDVRAVLGRVLLWPLPRGAGSRTRATLLRLAGVSIGKGTLVMSTPTITGGNGASRRVRIGCECFINEDCIFDATAAIVIGDEVNLGHGVLITTSDHAIGAPERRAGIIRPQPVHIEDGAWLASRVIVLPGVRIGKGAIVGAGAVVTRSVAPHTFVAGVPARLVRDLDDAGYPGRRAVERR